MKIVTLVNAQAAGSAITGTSTSFMPLNGYTSVFVVNVKRASGADTPTTTTTISLQGSLNGTDWVTIDSFAASALTLPVGVTDWTSTSGYRTIVKVVQGFPLMRVCTSGAISANMNLTAYIGNG